MKKRVVSGILIALVTVPLWLLGGIYFKLFCEILGLFCLKELIDLKEHHGKIPLFMVLLACIDFTLIVFSHNNLMLMPMNVLSLVILSLLIPCLIYKEGYSAKDGFYLIASVLVLGLVFNALITIRTKGMWYLFYVGSIPILTDIFAMLFGKFIGRHKLIPHISPGKTVEGSLGGLIVATISCTLIYWKTINGASFWVVLMLTCLLSFMGQLSDLVFSKIKRENGIKDFSSLIPGHGGFLDRLDSLMLVVLTYIILECLI